MNSFGIYVPAMKTFIALLCLSLTAASMSFAALKPAKQGAVETIQSFYRSYLGKAGLNQKAKLPFSKSFQTLVDKNSRICRQQQGDVCGWGADGDVYLNAQETDPKLSYDNSGITVTEIATGEILVKLNVYPSIKDAGNTYERKILFKMIQEKSKWVVDDIVYDGSSSRKFIEEENSHYTGKK